MSLAKEKYPVIVSNNEKNKSGRIKALLLQQNLVFVGDAFGDASAGSCGRRNKKEEWQFPLLLRLFYCGPFLLRQPQ